MDDKQFNAGDGYRFRFRTAGQLHDYLMTIAPSMADEVEAMLVAGLEAIRPGLAEQVNTGAIPQLSSSEMADFVQLLAISEMGTRFLNLIRSGLVKKAATNE